MTPLHYAARYGSLDQVNFLIANGANVNAQDSQEWTPLQHACYRSKNKRISVRDDTWSPHRSVTINMKEYNVEVTKALIKAMEEKGLQKNIKKILNKNYCHGEGSWVRSFWRNDVYREKYLNKKPKVEKRSYWLYPEGYWDGPTQDEIRDRRSSRGDSGSPYNIGANTGDNTGYTSLFDLLSGNY